MGDFTAIPCITVIAYLIGSVFKIFTKGTKNEFIPALCGVAGGVLGALCFFFFPDCIPGGNLLFSIATGILSGFSATGVNQMYKQMTEKKEKSE